MQFLVLTRSGDQLAVIDDYKSFELKERAYQQSSLKLTIDPSSQGSKELITDRFIVVNDEDVPTAFIIEQRESSMEMPGQHDVRCKEAGLFDNRVTIPDSGESHDTFTGSAESAQKHYILRNVGDQAHIERRLPNFGVEADGARGSQVTVRSRYQTLAKVLQRIGTASGAGWRTVYNRSSKSFEFRTMISVDRSADVILSIDMDSLTSERILIDQTEHRNHAIVGGQGQGSDRNIEEVWSGDPDSIYRQLSLDLVPMGYWRLGEESGSSIAYDDAGGLDGSHVGSVLLGVSGALAADDDTAANYPDDTSHSVVPIRVGAVGSFKAWVNVDAWTDTLAHGVFQSGDNELTNYAGWLALFRYSDTSQTFYYRIVNDAGTIVDIKFPYTDFFPTSGYAFVVATWGNGAMEIYVNDVLAGSRTDLGTYSGDQSGNNSESSRIAYGHQSAGNDTSIDEVALYDRKLTSDELTDLYEAGTQETGPIEWNRREAFLDARDIDLGDLAALRDRGEEGLNAAKVIESFEVDVHTLGSFKYKEDWNLTDLVRVRSIVEDIDKPMRVITVTTAYTRGSIDQTVELDRPWPTIEDRINGSVGIGSAGEGTVDIGVIDHTHPYIETAGDTATGLVDFSGGWYANAGSVLQSNGWDSTNYDAAPPADWPSGMSVLQVNNSDGASWPGNGYCFVNMVSAGYRSHQIAVDTSGSTYTRTYTSSGWDPWFPMKYDTGWSQLTDFQNGWEDYGGTEFGCYARRTSDVVNIKGLTRYGTFDTVALVLPLRFRPSHRQVFCTQDGAGQGRTDIRVDGSVYIASDHDSNSWVSIACSYIGIGL